MSRVIYVDCSPGAAELYERELHEVLPGLTLHRGDPQEHELAGLIADHVGVITGHTAIPATVIEQCSRLRVIVFLGTGVSSYVDMAAAERRAVRVHNVSGYGDRTIAEHTIGLIFSAVRQIAAQDRGIRSGVWERPSAFELEGKTLGLVGLGAVGRAVARLGTALGMKVIGWNRSGLPAHTPCALVDLDTVMSESDVVSLHLAHTPDTENIIDERRLNLMKPHGVLVNTARGALIDESALVDCLGRNRIAHAALDVFEIEPLSPGHPLAGLDNVTLTAHSAWSSREAAGRLTRWGFEKMRNALDGLSKES